jgi:hypothetical protein
VTERRTAWGRGDELPGFVAAASALTLAEPTTATAATVAVRRRSRRKARSR